MKILCCLWAVLFLFEAGIRGQEPAAILTLDDAVALAIRQNRQVRISELDVQKAGESTASVKTTRLPQFNAYIQAGEPLRPIDFTIPQGALGVYPATGPIPAQNSTIQSPQRFAGFLYASVAQPVSQFYKIGLAIRQSKVAEDAARESLRSKKMDIAHQVREAYYQIAQTQTQIASAEEELKYLTELSALTDRNLAEQTALKSDSLSVKAKLSQQRYQLLTLHDGLQTQKETLNQLAGRDLSADFSVEPQPVPSAAELDLASARKEALEQRSEIREARLQTKKAELDIRRQRAEYLPDVSIQLSYLSLPNVSFAPQNIINAGFVMQWQPFDWGQKKHKIEELRSASSQTTLTIQDAEQQVLLDVHNRFRKLLEARALLDTQAAVQEAEREKLRVMMNRYQQKSALLADLMQQQSSLAQADNQYQQSLAAFWSAMAAFDHALGRD
jgi:outer membrane protein